MIVSVPCAGDGPWWCLSWGGIKHLSLKLPSFNFHPSFFNFFKNFWILFCFCSEPIINIFFFHSVSGASFTSEEMSLSKVMLQYWTDAAKKWSYWSMANLWEFRWLGQLDLMLFLWRKMFSIIILKNVIFGILLVFMIKQLHRIISFVENENHSFFFVIIKCFFCLSK